MKRQQAIRIAAVTALAAACLSACADDSGGTASAEDVDARIAEINKSLEDNLYVKAAAESGEGENTCPKTLPEGETPEIVFSIEGLSHPFLVGQVDKAKAKAEELGAKLTVVSGDDDVNKQLNGVETALGSNPDALMMMPANTEGLGPILQQYEEAEIPYFFTQKGLLESNATNQVLAPYGEEGKILGEYVVEHYKDSEEPVKVALISGITGDVSSVARTGSFERELLESGNFEIVAEEPGEYRREESQTAMDSILAAHPDVELVFGANDEGALGALQAIKAAGKGGEIDVVGIDGQAETFPAIESGDILATVKHVQTAPYVVENIVKCLSGEAVPAFEVFPGDLVDAAAIEEGADPAF
jgi:ribose transport system substrate-binding protein